MHNFTYLFLVPPRDGGLFGGLGRLFNDVRSMVPIVG